jgi:hypothetical protein
MRTDLIVKSALVAAILFAAYKLLGGGLSRRCGAPQPFAFRRSEGYMDDTDSEMDEDDEYGEDSDDEEDDEEDIEGFSEAMPSARGAPGAPAMNLATSLLPKPSPIAKQNFGEFAPKSLLGQNFLSADKYIGVDTQGSSLRNANYDLRANPAIPRRDVGPWSQSTIEGDLFRKPLE